MIFPVGLFCQKLFDKLWAHYHNFTVQQVISTGMMKVQMTVMMMMTLMMMTVMMVMMVTRVVVAKYAAVLGVEQKPGFNLSERKGRPKRSFRHSTDLIDKRESKLI